MFIAAKERVDEFCERKRRADALAQKKAEAETLTMEPEQLLHRIVYNP